MIYSIKNSYTIFLNTDIFLTSAKNVDIQYSSAFKYIIVVAASDKQPHPPHF